MEQIIPQVEAILFVANEPVDKENLIKLLGIERTLLAQIIEKLKEKYNDPQSGLILIETAGGYQVVTKPQYAEVLEKFYGNRRVSKLSIPALETLAIIAYKQPVTKQEIEEIRGVNCDGVVKTLLDRDLIVKRGEADLPGKPALYHTTKKFLTYFKISSLKELPPIEELTNSVQQETIFDENENK